MAAVANNTPVKRIDATPGLPCLRLKRKARLNCLFRVRRVLGRAIPAITSQDQTCSIKLYRLQFCCPGFHLAKTSKSVSHPIYRLYRYHEAFYVNGTVLERVHGRVCRFTCSCLAILRLVTLSLCCRIVKQSSLVGTAGSTSSGQHEQQQLENSRQKGVRQIPTIRFKQ
jgi:hypothetical protein